MRFGRSCRLWQTFNLFYWCHRLSNLRESHQRIAAIQSCNPTNVLKNTNTFSGLTNTNTKANSETVNANLPSSPRSTWRSPGSPSDTGLRLTTSV